MKVVQQLIQVMQLVALVTHHCGWQSVVNVIKLLTNNHGKCAKVEGLICLNLITTSPGYYWNDGKCEGKHLQYDLTSGWRIILTQPLKGILVGYNWTYRGYRCDIISDKRGILGEE